MLVVLVIAALDIVNGRYLLVDIDGSRSTSQGDPQEEKARMMPHSPTLESTDCQKVMTDAGLEVSTFSDSVAHGIHSITVEELNSYFDGDVSEANSIPTVTRDRKNPQRILPYAPRMNKDPNVLTDAMTMIDFILRNSDDTKQDNTMFTALEKLAHAAHSKELYARTKPIYETIIKHPPKGPQLCSCVIDEDKNGVRASLARYTTWNVSFFKRFYEKNGEDIPKLESPNTWKIWKDAFEKHMLNKKEKFNFAMYLYCKLKAA